MTLDSPDVTATFAGSVDAEGRISLDEPALVTARLLRMFKRSRVDVTVTREKKRRSDAANRYFWSMVVPVFSEATGYTKDEGHDQLELMFCPRLAVELPNGQWAEKLITCSNLDPAQFAEFVEACCLFLAEQGWHVPAVGERVEAFR